MKTKTLHITDGESTRGSLRRARLGAGRNIVSWRDTLYAGPVPAGLTLRQLSQLRSRFWTGNSTTEFDTRHAAFARHGDYDEVVLWFGSTSLCQLSLVQLLQWFRVHGKDNTKLSLVSAYGGWLNPEQVLRAYGSRESMTAPQLRTAKGVWQAFCSSSPRALSQMLRRDLRALPELREALRFLLQEYPERHSGLSRLQRKLLQTVNGLGSTTPAFAIGPVMRQDLVGDNFLFDMLRGFVTAPHPLLRFVAQFKGKLTNYQFNAAEIELTDTGRAVLRGKADHVALNGIDRWIGGVHLSGNHVRWRWDDIAGGITTSPRSAAR